MSLSAFLLSLALAVTLVAGFGDAIQSGVDEDLAKGRGGSLVVGCTCHNADPSDNVVPILSGVPGVYGIAGTYAPKTYNISVSMEGGPQPGKGGFNLHVSAGTLAAGANETGVTITALGDATHSSPSDARRWNLTWAGPADAADAVIFRLTVNAVNGDGTNAGNLDQWNRLIVASQGVEGATVGTSFEEPVHVQFLGVNWFAYWVGIVSFIFLIVVLFVYYFVFRYSETSHATDHRDRKEKNK